MSNFKSTLILAYLWAYFVMHLDASVMKHKKNSKTHTTLPVRNNVCITKACKKTADTFLKNMDKHTHPCMDFYQFCCGNFVKKTVIQKGSDGVDTFGITEETIIEKIRDILESKIKSRRTRSYKMMQDYYKLCMDTSQLEKNSENDLRDIFRRLNGWPVLDGNSWNESAFDWKNTTYLLSKMGYSSNFLFSIDISPDRNDSEKNIIYIDQAELSNNQEDLSKGLESPVIKAYLKYMIDFAVAFGANRGRAKMEMTETLIFEIQLGLISLSNVERSDEAKLYNKMKIQDLQNSYKEIPWLEYFNNIIHPQRLLTAKDKVMVGPKKFFKSIGPLLSKTPKRVIANYLMWSVADSSSILLSERIQNISRQYDLAYSGTANRRDRWKICVDRVRSDLSIALGAVYVRQFFDESSKNDVLDLLNNITKSYKRIIKQIVWMSEKAKIFALEKLDAMKKFIGFPKELLDDNKVNDFYKHYKINRKSLLKTKLAFDAIEFERLLKKFQKPINKTYWADHASAATVNAYYENSQNSIEFPAGILQGLFFSKDRPKYLNYGAIGMIMGHEMTHGFDDEGSHYDKNGNFIIWRDDETKARFIAEARGIVKQYNNFYMKDLKQNISGKLTEGENIADNGGYKEAYLAYVDWAKKHRPEPGLKGLPYTPRQLFWISAANVWCEKYRVESALHLVKTDPHSPGEFRTNGPVSNRKEFAVDFHCPPGSPMNPVKKYGVW